MDKCQYYKGTDKIDADTTRILCSYMTSGGKTFKNKDPEGAALIQCCWHREKAERECPLFNEDNIDETDTEEVNEVSDIPSDIDNEVIEDIAERTQQLQELADKFLQNKVMCPYYGEAGKVVINSAVGGLHFECSLCDMEFAEESKAADWLSRCRSNPKGCLHYKHEKDAEKASVKEYEPDSSCCQYFGGYKYVDYDCCVHGAMNLDCSHLSGGGFTFNLGHTELLEKTVLENCKCGGKGCVFLMTDEELEEYHKERDEEEEKQSMEQEQQVFTTEVAASNDTQVSSERQDRAAKLTQQIIANGKIAANSMIEMGRDLKAVRDERLFTEMGYENFEEYCEKKIGIGKRHGYNFIQIYEKFGEEKLGQLQQFGITKLLEIAKLDDEDADDLLQHNDINALSVRELSAKVDEYRNKYEQLTMQLEEEKSKNSENASLESQVEELKRFTATLNDNYNKALKEKAEAMKEHQSEMKKLTADRNKQVEELKKQLEAAREENEDLQSGALNAEKYFEDQKDAMLKEKKALSEKIKELESRPAEKAEISEAERAALIQQGRDEMCKEKDESWGAAVELARKTATRNTEKKFTEEIDSLKTLNDELRKVADGAKESTKKYKDEVEKLKAENAALQSTAQVVETPAPAPTSGARDKVKFYFKQIETAFTAATEAVSEADTEERAELTSALKKVLERMGAILEQT